MSDETKLINELSERQLHFYNLREIEGFADCYHPEVKILDTEGNLTLSGLESLREKYGQFFKDFPNGGARIESKIQHGPHSVELEHWWRAEEKGTVIVRFTLREGKIGWVQFMR